MVRDVTLTWHRVHCPGCDAEHAPTPNKQHAHEQAAAHTCHDADGGPLASVERVKVDRHHASCDEPGCGWEGNPAELKRDANAQLTDHRKMHSVETEA